MSEKTKSRVNRILGIVYGVKHEAEEEKKIVNTRERRRKTIV